MHYTRRALPPVLGNERKIQGTLDCVDQRLGRSTEQVAEAREELAPSGLQCILSGFPEKESPLRA